MRSFSVVWLLLVLLDQLSKLWASAQGFVVMNRGVSFAWLSAVSSEWLLIGLMLFGLGAIWSLRQQLVRQPLAAGLVIAGITSNLFDRMWFGGVRDWLPIPLFDLRNNLADYALISGLIWLAAGELKRFMIRP